MEMFVSNDEVKQWECELPGLQDMELLAARLRLAWHLRQRDTARALYLSDAAEQLLNTFFPAYLDTNSGTVEFRLMRARLVLVRAEAAWLYGEFDKSGQLSELALRLAANGDTVEAATTMADAHYLLACIGLQKGEVPAVESEISLAIHFARQAGDGMREIVAESLLANQQALRNLPLALECWGAIRNPHNETTDPVLRSYINEFLIYTYSLTSDFGQSAARGIQVFEFAKNYGQKRRMISVASNIGDAFNSLSDHQSALQWIQEGLDLARAAGWPNSIASCLIQMSETLRRLGRLEAAKEMLENALPILVHVVGSRSHLLALRYFGDLSLDMGDYATAQKSFQELISWADKKNHLDFRIGSRRGYADALSMQGQAKAALDAALEALALARQSTDSYRHIEVLRVLAALYMRHSLPEPVEMQALSAALHYLRQAFDVAGNISNFNVPAELYQEIADAYAAAQDFHQAFECAKLALAAREKNHNREAANRLNAMQLSQQTERMRAESEHLRQLAAAEAQRAEVLQQTSVVLEKLGTIGQEITASLDAPDVFKALNRHVHDLLHVTALVIYLMNDDQQSMTSAYGVENGMPIEPDTVYMASAVSNSVRCVRERREIAIELASEDELLLTLIPGTEMVQSMLFAPLIIGDRVLGAMTIQSSRQHVYGDREKMIFRSLCAYGAIALGNADAYLRLQKTQEHLLAQEKLAALGSLVAGVAHELNTPIGNCLLVASTLQDGSRYLSSKLAGQNLRRSDLNNFCEEVKTSSEILMRGLSSAATLVSSFKQVAVDRTSEHRRSFDLRQVLHDIIATLNIRITQTGHSVELNVPYNIHMDSYPGSLGQVISNLVENAILHAFDKRQSGQMSINASQVDGQRVLIVFSDNGVGIPEENQKRIFDPFFTTKLGQGGSGLGLNICYNITTSILHGQLSVKSSLGAGTSFYLNLPLIV
ncbi:tetratricopeptide repeat-containing sensor histidine kinase [Undibacterium umbellatum]|uniref:histidine kinase n=1 Tax=Undibacterium umbellatum TaxID=2762300 RepID=A0ABR6ZEL1_9BURK|nr:tetratricopeptide repeat-containing sensor histidine kinase [Undibacterium umbellatum]MBC3910016.1 tetratricopeptide repeat-containing sensor histidine kinase [Undibacterium umbellatum]